MYWDLDFTPEDEEEIIKKIAREIRRYGLDVAAILFLESSKPLSFIGSQMGRVFISPFLPAISDDISIQGEKLFRFFEKHENVEKLITALEEMEREEKAKKQKKAKDSTKEQNSEKKGWRRFIPF